MCRIVLKLVHMHLVANTRMKTTLLYSCIACTCTYVSMVHNKVCIFSSFFARSQKRPRNRGHWQNPVQIRKFVLSFEIASACLCIISPRLLS